MTRLNAVIAALDGTADKYRVRRIGFARDPWSWLRLALSSTM
ncbi:MAG: hypothetical protein ACLVEF_07885 [Bifidobacterium bifidum]